MSKNNTKALFDRFEKALAKKEAELNRIERRIKKAENKKRKR